MPNNSKQLIERNLKFDDRYIYLSLTRGSVIEGQTSICDNCGQLITNMVNIVRKSDSKHFTIGTDCADTLIKAKCFYNNGTDTDYHIDVYGYNRAAKVATELKKGTIPEIITDWLIRVKNNKDKWVECHLSDMKKYFPELIASHIETK